MPLRSAARLPCVCTISRCHHISSIATAADARGDEGLKKLSRSGKEETLAFTVNAAHSNTASIPGSPSTPINVTAFQAMLASQLILELCSSLRHGVDIGYRGPQVGRPMRYEYENSLRESKCYRRNYIKGDWFQLVHGSILANSPLPYSSLSSLTL